MNSSRSLAKRPSEVSEEKAKRARMKKKSPRRFLAGGESWSVAELRLDTAIRKDVLEGTEVDADLVVQGGAEEGDHHRRQVMAGHEHGVSADSHPKSRSAAARGQAGTKPTHRYRFLNARPLRIRNCVRKLARL
jgi:hypothetical protein